MKTAKTAAFFLCALCVSNVSAAVDQHEHSLDTLEAAKNVEYVSQKIAKAYFYKHLDIRPDHAKTDMEQSLAKLKNGIIKLKECAEDKETKNLTIFLAHTHSELDKMLEKPYSKEHGALMIDFSESLLEGANVLASKHLKGGSAEETMMVEVERLNFLLERINKYYIAHHAGFTDYNNVVQVQQAVKDFETSLAKVNAHNGYPDSVKGNVKNINQFWPVAKEFYLGVQKNALPVIVLASTDKLEKEISQIEKHHHQEAEKK
jgi:hypothetical protein